MSEESWDDDRLNVGLFKSALPQVRRVLANVPSLMIFDDHEITDDWNIDLPWVNTVYASTNKAGRRAVTNGLLAYLLCQHWGNKPAAFTTAGSPEQRALAAVSSAVSAATPRSAAETCAPLLGLPADKLPTAPPAQALRDLSAAGAIRYDHALGPDDGWPVRIVLMDERTVREYPRTDSRGARISRAALGVAASAAADAGAVHDHRRGRADPRQRPRRERDAAAVPADPAGHGRALCRLRVVVGRDGEPPGPARADRRSPPGRCCCRAMSTTGSRRG